MIEKTWPKMTPVATAVSPEEGHAVYPVIWTNEFGGGRVFATSLGHAGVWTDPVFQELITRGFRWALKMDVTGTPAAAK